MKACWLTDVHLDFVDCGVREGLLSSIERRVPDVVLLGGDISRAPRVAADLAGFAERLAVPVHVVLGNHDFYLGSVGAVREAISALCLETEGLTWLSEAGVQRLSSQTALVGHDGWGDGRLGCYEHSPVRLNDSVLIEELCGLNRRQLRGAMQALGDDAAEHLAGVVPEALSVCEHVVVLTHVPPFREAAWYDGKPSDDDWLPFFSCKAVGDVLLRAMQRHPERRMTVLCGHTHGSGEVGILPNLTVHTGGARYGRPTVQQVFDWD